MSHLLFDESEKEKFTPEGGIPPRAETPGVSKPVSLTDPLDQPLGTHVETQLDDLIRFARSGHLQMAPVEMAHEKGGFLMIRHTHGFYTLAEHVDRGVLLLYAHDHTLFDPLIHADEDLRGGAASGLWVNPASAPQIQVPDARDARDGEKWALAELNEHNYRETKELERFGYLWRTTPSLFVSGSVCYKTETVPVNKKNPDMGERVRVRCYTTEGKEHQFPAFQDQFLASAWGKMLTAGALRAYVPKDKVITNLSDDFLKRTHLIFRAIDPSRLGHLGKERDMASALSPFRENFMNRLGVFTFLKTGFARFSQAVYTHFNSHKNTMTGKITPILFAIVTAAFQLLTRGVIAGVLRLVGSVVKPVAEPFIRIFKKPVGEGLFHGGANVAARYGKKDYLGTQADGYYNLLDTEAANYLRYLMPDETQARAFRGAAVQEELHDDFAAHVLLDPYGAPEGSLFEKRRINNMDVLRILQPDGVEIYNLVGKNVAYVRYRPDIENKHAQKMHVKIRELLSGNNYLRVYQDGERVLYGKLDHDKFTAGINAETVTPARPADAKPLSTLHVLQEEWDRVARPVKPEGLVEKANRHGYTALVNSFKKMGDRFPVDEEARKTLRARMNAALHGVMDKGEAWATRRLDNVTKLRRERAALETVLKTKVPYAPPENRVD